MPPFVFRTALVEPTAIDPYKAQETEGILVCKALFAGLLRQTARGSLTPATAHSWECDPSGRTWTFRLRDDTCFSDGEPVTAHSFVRGWERALDPKANTETAYHLAGVEGFDDVRAGRTDRLVGAVAVDDRTLVVRLSHPDVQFDLKTVQPVFSPVPLSAGPALDQTFNDQPIGNGPFMMDGPWKHGHQIRLVRNPRWWGEPVALDAVHIDILDPVTALDDEYAGFLAGRYDYARIPPERLPEAARHLGGAGFLEEEGAGLHYLIPFCHQPPMDTVDARRAVSHAIDRQGLADRLFHGRRTPAHSLLSPWFGGAHAPAGDDDPTAFDPEAARAAALRAGLPSGSVVDFAVNTGAGHEGWTSAIAESLHQVLGWDVRLRVTDARGLVDHRTSEAASGLCRAAWACDYGTPDNMLYPLLHSSCTAPDADGTAHGDNEGRYVNSEFDAALTRARACTDPEGRNVEWRLADAIATRDLALIPLWYRTDQRVFDADRLTGVAIDFDGNPTLTTVRPV
ncbi:peptide ABC transporter substrate-binding protein [Streptomyces botrytidirepellens]|uniref:ABC transporter substrate-binding protein n=1 Tax=Streptomyces botrytidirepellens TaxID=2486417 RepID=A0A3M8SQ86_9ACTN|nr:ABC transporter substrate-binding protein [Streptomyces botrytidirepellens]RNF83429.1 ABC transporter substrate-binding protein [Streptomyces botrytidirepellens]